MQAWRNTEQPNKEGRGKDEKKTSTQQTLKVWNLPYKKFGIFYTTPTISAIAKSARTTTGTNEVRHIQQVLVVSKIAGWLYTVHKYDKKPKGGEKVKW